MEGFETLQQMYREALPEKCAALQSEWRSILAGAVPEPHAQALRRQLHQLSGSGGAYGFDAMGEMARELEKRWVQWLRPPASQRIDPLKLAHDLHPLMNTLLAALRAASLPPGDGFERPPDILAIAAPRQEFRMNPRFPPISLIGAPTDIGAGHRGASMGPEALRVAGIGEALRARGLEVVDRGNLLGPPNPWLPPVDGYRHLEEVVAWNRAVLDAVYAELAAGRLPILLGGDHCLGIGSITAVARWCRERSRKLRVIWLDAHADFNTSFFSPESTERMPIWRISSGRSAGAGPPSSASASGP